MIKMCVCVSGMHRSVNFFKCQFSVSSMSVAMPSNIVYGKVSCHILVQCSLHASHVEKSVMSCHEKCLSCFSASHMEKVSIMPDALQFVCFTYIYIYMEKVSVMSRSIAICMYYMQKSVPSHLDALQFACLTYGKGVHYVTIHCNLHALHPEKCPVTSGCIAICMLHIWKRCPLCHNTLQFACITSRKVSRHIWMHCNLHASHMEKVSAMSQYIAICMHHIQKSVLLCLDTLHFVCFTYGKGVRYVTIHCNLHALHPEKCPVMSGYIAICMLHIWKKVSVMWCIAICMQFYLALGGGGGEQRRGGGDSAEPPVRNVGVLGELSGGEL